MSELQQSAANKKMDRRTRKTIGAIRSAFMEILTEKPLDRVTVTEIAKRADLDRKTFYLHYESIESLVDEMLYEEVEHLSDTLSEVTIDDTGNFDVLELFRVLSAELVLEFEEKAAILVHTDMETTLRRLEPILVKSLAEKDLLQLADHLGPYLDVFVAYFCSGLLAVYRKWVETDSELPLEQLASMTGAVMAGGVASLITASELYVKQ